MALTFPRDMTDLTRWSDPKLRLARRQELSRVQGGLTQGKDMGPPLWTANWTSVPIRLADADAVKADFDSLMGVVRTFHLYPPTRSQPREMIGSPAALGSVTVGSIRADNAAFTLAGLPSGFVMSAGDFVSVSTAAGGVEFFQLVRGGTANGSGVTPALEVSPHVRPAVAAGDAVTLIKPLVEMRLDPDALDDPLVSGTHRQITFKATQVIR